MKITSQKILCLGFATVAAICYWGEMERGFTAFGLLACVAAII